MKNSCPTDLILYSEKCPFDLFLTIKNVQHTQRVPLPLLCAFPSQELVDELYNFRDCYLEAHSVEEAGRKQSDVAQEIKKTLKKLKEKESECFILHNRALVFNLQIIIPTYLISVFTISHRSF